MVEVTLSNDDRPTFANLHLQLIDIPKTVVTTVASQFNFPQGVAVDASGNLYVSDYNHRIQKVTPAGVVTTFAGSTAGHANGTGAAAQFDVPWGLAFDASGNLYVADLSNHRIRKVTPAGVVSTIAGSGTAGFADENIGTNAQFDNPSAVAVDALGNVYVADYDNHRIRKVTPAGVVTTLAGSGTAGFVDDNIGSDAQFNNPSAVAVDASGNVYVADANNNRIRKVTPAGGVTTLAGGTLGFADGTGTDAKFYNPMGLAIDASGNLYVADNGTDRIRKVTSAGVVTTLVGGTRGYVDGTGTAAQFYSPRGMAVDSLGNIYVVDASNDRVRKIQ